MQSPFPCPWYIEELYKTNHSPKASIIYIKIKKELREVCTNFVAN